MTLSLQRSLLAAVAGIALGAASALAVAQTTTTAPAPAPATAPATAPADPVPGSTAPATQEPAATPAPAPEVAPAPAPEAAAQAEPASAPVASGEPPDTTAHHPKDVEYSFDGPFGTFDRAQLQRGFQIYKEVCSVCHGLRLVAFHTLSDEGGPGFSEAQMKAIAAAIQVPADPDEQGRTHDNSGQRIKRAGISADYFPSPYENEKAARAANNGNLPPDLSVMAKAREGGPAYIYSLLTGYGTAPANEPITANMSYNAYFPGHQIAMPPPLTDGVVTYSDGTPASIDNMAKDVSAFLMWTAEPKMEERKRVGFGVMAFLLLLSGLLYFAYRKVWHGEH